MTDLSAIANEFLLTGKIREIVPLGSGHIHQTYKVVTEKNDADDYVLQQINTHVFRDPEAVMHNFSRVTSHIKQKLVSSGVHDIRRKVISPVELRKGGWLYIDPDNRAWRCFLYIPDHRTYDRAVSESQVYEGGKAYGSFLRLLSDMPAGTIRETIPGFHDLRLRLNQFEEACKNGICERITETTNEIELLKKRRDEMLAIQQLADTGKIPLRIVHHDTKINNVLFDQNDGGLCVIDLDTVMPGLVHDDFGDSIRTFTNTGDEDDACLDHVSMNLAYFEAYAKGYLEQTASILNREEKDYLALSSRVMTYMQALRFLADYLNGDIYYRIHHPGHNLQRARAQIKLMLSMEEQFGAMKQIIVGLG